MPMARRILGAALLIGGLLSLTVAGLRAGQEWGDRQVALIADWDDLLRLTVETGWPLSQVLQELQGDGLTAVALPENTLHGLMGEGRVEVVSGRPAPLQAGSEIVAGLTIWSPDPGLLHHLSEMLQRKYPPQCVRAHLAEQDYWIWLGDLQERALHIGLGLDPLSIQQIRAAGLEVVPRLQNDPLLTPETASAWLDALQQQNLRLLIPSEAEVFGFADLIPQVASEIRKRPLLYGDVEFGKQKGAERLAARLTDRLVRVHSITAQEMETLPEEQAVLRYLRAVRERNVRACYLHFYLEPGENRWDRNRAYVRQLATALTKAGFRLGNANALATLPSRNRVVVACLGLALYGAALAAFMLFFGPLPASGRAWAAAGAAIVVLAAAGAPGLFSKLAALAATLLAPTAAGLWSWRRLKQLPSTSAHPLAAWKAAATGLLTASGISWLGALLVVGLLSESAYMTGVSRFAGVKVALFFPLLLVGLFMLSEPHDQAGVPSWSSRQARWRELPARPILIGQVGVLVVLVGVAALLLLRSGNEAAAVSAWELRLREALEQWLWVRPRTKEWLIGHPALFLAFAAAARGHRFWLPLLLLLGMVGQTSLVNTFCHLHTPLVISVVRSLHGLWIGLLVGTLALAAAGWFWQRNRTED